MNRLSSLVYIVTVAWQQHHREESAEATMSDSDSSDVVGRDSPVRLVADSLSSSDDEDARVPRPKQSSHFGTGMVRRPSAPLPSDGRGGGREEERVSIEDTLTTGCYDEGELLDYDESLDMDSGAVKVCMHLPT